MHRPEADVFHGLPRNFWFQFFSLWLMATLTDLRSQDMSLQGLHELTGTVFLPNHGPSEMPPGRTAQSRQKMSPGISSILGASIPQVSSPCKRSRPVKNA